MMATLATTVLMAQSAGDSSVPFKERLKNGATDNFTIREIKKKELQITPSKIVSLNYAPARHEKKNHQRSKGLIDRSSYSLYIPMNFLDSSLL